MIRSLIRLEIITWISFDTSRGQVKQGYNHFGNAEEWIIENNSSNRILEMIGKEKEYLKMTRESHTKSRPNTMSKQNDFYRVEGEEDQEDTLTVEIRTGMNKIHNSKTISDQSLLRRKTLQTQSGDG